MVVPLLSTDGQRALIFHQNILMCALKMNEDSCNELEVGV